MSVSRESLLKVLRDRVLARVQRGPLLDISIGKSARRFDLLDLGNDDPQRAYDALKYVVSRSPGKLTLPILEDEEAGVSKEDADVNVAVLRKIERIKRTVSLYERETGVNPLYLAFPLIMVREADTGGKARCILAPLFVWPLMLNIPRTQQGQVEIGFDKERGLIHENPALQPWLKERFNVEVNLEEAAGKLTALDRITWENVLSAATECMKGFQRVSLLRETAPLLSVPKKDDQLPPNQVRIYSSAAVAIIDWIHQSIVADLAKLSQENGDAQLLDLFLGLRSGDREDGSVETVPEEDRFFLADADPAQQKAVLRARNNKGLVIHGPPGTGKSQTIVNVVIDSVAKGQKVLVVCQKQAAINVVAKRLTKEGVSNLAVVVHDAMKDRVRVIEDLKKQIENWAQPSDATIDEHRRSACRKIVEIERELRAYTEALWTSKSKSGLSYRQILARLARLRVGHPSSQELRDLRPLLATSSESQVRDLAEQIAELAPLWQNARLEGNPWRSVKSFLFNDQSATEIKEALSAAAEVLRVRDDHLEKFPNVLSDLDSVALEIWLHEADVELKKLADETWRTRVGSWMNFLESFGEQASAKMLGDLAVTCGDLELLKTAHEDICWANHFREIDDSELYSIQQNCELFLKHYKRWFRWLSATYKSARTIVGEHAAALKVPLSGNSATRILTHCEHFLRLREKREIIRKAFLPLGAEVEALPLHPAKLFDYCSVNLKHLQSADAIRATLEKSPAKSQLTESIKGNSSDALQVLLARLQQTCRRAELDRASLQTLLTLKDFLNEDFFAAVERRIDEGKIISPILPKLAAKISTIPAIQEFHFFRSKLPGEASVVFDILKNAEVANDTPTTEPIDRRWFTSIRISALAAWRQELESLYPHLVQLPSGYYQSQVKKLEQLDEQKKRLNREAILALQAKQPVAGERVWRNILVKTGRGSKRLRQVISMGGSNGIFDLRPVWLTNPETVSQIFPLREGLFDLVVFDEASQLPPEFAVAALYRAKRAVVSGDEHQLPPTSFFQAGFEIGSDSEVETDLEELERKLEEQPDNDGLVAEYERLQNATEARSAENLLDIGRRVLPQSWLTIHYRSRFSELIRFSNVAFYESKLRMPVAHPPESLSSQKPIDLRRINSIYSQDQTNRGEAEEVVKYLRSLWIDNMGPPIPTVGVVTFNIHQREAILDALEYECERDRSFADIRRREECRKDGEEDVGFFVKNLENIQGDERDVMIFSTTFGKRADGRFARFFGPLSQKGGQRRLNVAITRARDRIVIFTSMPIEQISDALTRPLESVATGVRPRDILQLYMAYAEACDRGSFEAVEEILKRARSLSYGGFSAVESIEDYDSDFEMHVAEVLRCAGFKVLSQVNEGEFRIDLAVVHPSEQRYALGIECDGATFHSSWTARSHDIWRQKVLQSCGWKIYRIWSTDWWRDPNTQIDALLRTVRRACSSSI